VVSSRGIPSLSQLRISFEKIQDGSEAGKDVFIYQFGDHDPTGCLIPRHIERQINEWCDEEGCDRPTVERVALTEAQIEQYRLPTRPTKRAGNPHARGSRAEASSWTRYRVSFSENSSRGASGSTLVNTNWKFCER
jgi:hypothetical protein